MKLFTDEQLKRVPLLCIQRELKDEAIVKIVAIFQKSVWLITEFDFNDLFFGFVYANEKAELKYFSKSDLENLNNENSLEIIEVDMNLKEAKEILFNKNNKDL